MSIASPRGSKKSAGGTKTRTSISTRMGSSGSTEMASSGPRSAARLPGGAARAPRKDLLLTFRGSSSGVKARASLRHELWRLGPQSWRLDERLQVQTRSLRARTQLRNRGLQLLYSIEEILDRPPGHGESSRLRLERVQVQEMGSQAATVLRTHAENN